MPVYEASSQKGDLIVTYQVELPKKLTQEQKDSKYSALINFYLVFKMVFQMS